MNSFFDTTHLFNSYSIEHFTVLGLFLLFTAVFFIHMGKKNEAYQRKILFGIAVILSISQLLKIPLNVLTDTFDPTKDIPLHMCNFLPMVMMWVYYKKSQKVWAAIFFWVIIGVSQANLTPSVEFSLFHYDAIRYWLVHLMLVILALYPAIKWNWGLSLKDVRNSVLALNVVAAILYPINLALNSNYLYIMGKPPGTTFFSILPEWPVYILYLEVILVIWALFVWAVFNRIKKKG